MSIWPPPAKALAQGTIVLIKSPGHRVDGQLGFVISGPGEFMNTYSVEVGGIRYGLLPSELTPLQPVPEHPIPDIDGHEYNTIMNALLAAAHISRDALIVADSIRKKFGQHAPHRK